MVKFAVFLKLGWNLFFSYLWVFSSINSDAQGSKWNILKLAFVAFVSSPWTSPTFHSKISVLSVHWHDCVCQIHIN